VSIFLIFIGIVCIISGCIKVQGYFFAICAETILQGSPSQQRYKHTIIIIIIIIIITRKNIKTHCTYSGRIYSIKYSLKKTGYQHKKGEGRG